MSTIVNINDVSELKVGDCLKNLGDVCYKIMIIGTEKLYFKNYETLPLVVVQTLLNSKEWFIWRDNENTPIE